MSNPEIWGPPLWRLLHTLAERMGRHQIPLVVADERRAWIAFLRQVEHVIPCQKCRAHYNKWKGNHKLDAFLHYPPSMVREEARKWVWGLHTEVNTERSVDGPPLSDIAAMYEKRNLTRDFEDCVTAFKNALQQSLIAGDSVRQFKLSFSKLRAFLG